MAIVPASKANNHKEIKVLELLKAIGFTLVVFILLLWIIVNIPWFLLFAVFVLIILD